MIIDLLRKLCRRRVRFIILREPILEEEELTAAFAGADKNPLWRPLMQLIDTAVRNAHANANENIESNTKLVGYTAGAEHLLLLRDDIVIRQETAAKALRRRRPAETLRGGVVEELRG